MRHTEGQAFTARANYTLSLFHDDRTPNIEGWSLRQAPKSLFWRKFFAFFLALCLALGITQFGIYLFGLV